MASTVSIAANAPKRLNAPRSRKLVAYQAYSIHDHQTGMKSAANSAIPSIEGSSCSVCATAPTATTKQRSKKSSSHEARRSGSAAAPASGAEVAMVLAINGKSRPFPILPREDCEDRKVPMDGTLLLVWVGQRPAA